jgi:hypothetical protein
MPTSLTFSPNAFILNQTACFFFNNGEIIGFIKLLTFQSGRIQLGEELLCFASLLVTFHRWLSSLATYSRGGRMA